ncbi:hypothetical protein V1514DRAFT_324803 [Lipomyces japonicus]|uniref:uncharacterized protein n=1 Tax=Lipomyces japonicus TaxID=56871 RepID=UPI0034CE893A
MFSRPYLPCTYYYSNTFGGFHFLSGLLGFSVLRLKKKKRIAKRPFFTEFFFPCLCRAFFPYLFSYTYFFSFFIFFCGFILFFGFGFGLTFYATSRGFVSKILSFVRLARFKLSSYLVKITLRCRGGLERCYRHRAGLFQVFNLKVLFMCFLGVSAITSYAKQ